MGANLAQLRNGVPSANMDADLEYDGGKPSDRYEHCVLPLRCRCLR